MWLIDRYIFKRFLANFAMLFLLLYVFVVAIDLILQLDEFMDAVRQTTDPNAGFLTVSWKLAVLVANFHGPRIFQFYSYLMGLVAIGAAGFTLAQLHSHRELVAVMASGVSLHRIAMPIMAAAVALNVLQLANQELVLPQIAPLLIREHNDIGAAGLRAFAVPLTRDGHGDLLQAPKFDQVTATLTRPTILQRDENGRTIRRITAEKATWNVEAGQWTLTNGRALMPLNDSDPGASSPSAAPVETWATDLTPDVLLLRRHAQYASLLSLARLNEMMDSPGVVDHRALARFKYSRFSAVLVNLLVLALSLPFFLLREPASLLRQSVLCAGVAIPAMLGALVGLTVDVPGISPAVGVFLPVVILIPITMSVVPFVKT